MFPNIAHTLAAPLPLFWGHGHGHHGHHGHHGPGHGHGHGHHLWRRRAVEKEEEASTPVVEPNYYFESDKTEGYLYVEIPGVEKNDINIEVHGHHLAIAAKRFEKSFVRTEEEKREMVNYDLELRLGHDADIPNIAVSEYRDGVLALRIPVIQRHEPRRISVEL